MNSENKKTILLVEDDAILAMTEKMSLEKHGYSVITAPTGEKSIEVVNTNPEINIILMDIDLGKGIDGTQAAEIILKDHDLPIVFLSSHIEPEIVEKTEKITSYGYVVKSSSITVLDTSIKMAFKLFKANKKINVSDIYQKTMISNISDVIGIVDADAITKYVSPNIEKWFGWKQKDLLGTDGWLVVHPDDQPHLKKKFIELINKDNLSIMAEYRYKCKDGNYKPIEMTAINLLKNPAIGGVLLNYHDISERKKAEAALKASEKNYRDIFNAINDAIIIHDIKTGAILDVNSIMEKMWGYTRDEAMQIDTGTLSQGEPPYSLKDAENWVHKAATEGSQEFEWLARRKNGELFWLEVKLQKVVIAGEERIMAVDRDITKRKLAEEEIKKQLSEKSILLNEVHHRMKNNIASIESLLLMQLNAIKNPEAVPALQDAITRVQGMRILYDKLLISKNYHEVSIKAYTETLIEAIIEVFPESNKINIKKQIANFSLNTKLMIPIGIIINELFTNIFKYAFTNNSEGQVSIILDKTDNHISLIIEDNGKGINEKADLSKSPGFGLSIVKMLAQQLGGTFRIENNNGTKSILNFDI